MPEYAVILALAVAFAAGYIASSWDYWFTVRKLRSDLNRLMQESRDLRRQVQKHHADQP